MLVAPEGQTVHTFWSSNRYSNNSPQRIEHYGPWIARLSFLLHRTGRIFMCNLLTPISLEKVIDHLVFSRISQRTSAQWDRIGRFPRSRNLAPHLMDPHWSNSPTPIVIWFTFVLGPTSLMRAQSIITSPCKRCIWQWSAYSFQLSRYTQLRLRSN